MTLLSLRDFTVTRGRCPVLEGIDLTVTTGELVGLLGPNGAGKTTLMRAALGLMPHRGTSSLSALPARDRGRAAAWLPQAREIAWPVSVERLVTLGRIPHLAAGAAPGPADRAAIDAALAAMELDSFRGRAASRLSGGEQARVLLARALAQEAPLLMADEPVAGLDPSFQIATMRSFARLAAGGRSVIVSLHDLGLAARHCTRLVVLDRGRLVADGPPAAVLTPERLHETFGISAWFAQTEHGPVFQPLEVTG